MKNVTLFAPTDEALAKPEAVAELGKFREDKDRLRDLLLYHTTGPEVQSCDFSNDKELKSGLADKSIRINLYATVSVPVVIWAVENKGVFHNKQDFKGCTIIVIHKIKNSEMRIGYGLTYLISAKAVEDV